MTPRAILLLAVVLVAACGEGTGPATRADRPLLFITSTGTGQAVVSIAPDGTVPRTLRSVTGSIGGIAWSPDGRHVAYNVDGTIRVMRSDGSDDRTVFTHSSIKAGRVAWSPDGAWIAFEGCEAKPAAPSTGLGIRYECATFAFPLAGGTLHTLATDRFAPDWNPRDARLVVVAPLSAQVEQQVTPLWTLRSDGSDLQPLSVTGVSTISHVTWSPDGTRLAATVPEPYTLRSAIWVFDATGKNARPLRCTGAMSCGAPAWAPDGRRLAFVRDGAILVGDASGTNFTPVPWPANVSALAW
ncbi:MAG: PD40 domain-containing protein [Gemmatimonadaceae bacterium]|nr:PD40 domain-containing protein [Gemmatimonadaceae bacterium]